MTDRAGADDVWETLHESWRTSESVRDLFRRDDGGYVDGGTIDDTPSNSAIDAVREWMDREGQSRGSVALDPHVVFLHPEPMVDPVAVQDPPFHRVVQRTRDIQEDGVEQERLRGVVLLLPIAICAAWSRQRCQILTQNKTVPGIILAEGVSIRELTIHTKTP
jgi:hypothetical protein